MNGTRKIKVLVAEDSSVARMLLVHLLQSDPEIDVIGAVHDGEAALQFARHTRPDVIVMDIHMPKMDGFEATRRIMESQPVPIIVCSAVSNVRDTAIAFRALEVGAIACIDKPLAQDDPQFPGKVAHLLETVKLMSEVKVVRRRPRSGTRNAATPAPGAPPRSTVPPRLIGIGASTGGPPVLQTILGGLPRSFPVPVLVVQHIAPGFLAGMVDWLCETTGLQVRIASYGTLPMPGHVYLAPDDFHMGIGSGGRIVLSREPLENHVRPAVSFLFRSLADHCGPAGVGVLLTGMGHDGAEEMKRMKDRGAVTIAQDHGSSVVHGMPGAAIALDGASQVLPAERIAAALIALATPKRA
jgi:two-component system, chemotaxis family, protein-glutamate methylesterase/glutaminase